jgi:hypothetical protein
MSVQDRRWAGVALCSGLLAACGGGGGDPPAVVVPSGARVVAASAGSDVSAANYTLLAGPMVRSLLSSGSNELLDPTAAGRTTAQAATAAVGVQVPTLVGRTVLFWLPRLPDPARKQIAAVSTQTLVCSFGGSVTVSFDDADNNGLVSAGDGIGLSAQACIEDPALPAISGGFTMRVNAVELNGQDEPTALDVSASFQAFELAGYGTMNGSFRLWTRPETAASTRLRISYLDTTVAEAAGTVVYNVDVDGLANAAGGSFEISGGLGIGGQTYAVSTGTRFSYAVGAAPASGNASLRDAAGDALRVIARSATTLDLEFLPAGSALPAASQTGLLWADFED